MPPAPISCSMRYRPSVWPMAMPIPEPQLREMLPPLPGVKLLRSLGPPRGIGAVEEVEQSRQHYKDEQAGFATAWPPGKPLRTMEAHIEQVSGNRLTIVPGVRLREDDHVGIVRSCVKPRREPKASRPAQCKAPEQSIERDADGVDPVLVRLEQQVHQAEERREHNRRRPEADSLAQSLQKVPAEEEFFPKAQRKHRESPEHCVVNKIAAVERESME